jgi:hypothetical protein
MAHTHGEFVLFGPLIRELVAELEQDLTPAVWGGPLVLEQDFRHMPLGLRSYVYRTPTPALLAEMRGLMPRITGNPETVAFTNIFEALHEFLAGFLNRPADPVVPMAVESTVIPAYSDVLCSGIDPEFMALLKIVESNVIAPRDMAAAVAKFVDSTDSQKPQAQPVVASDPVAHFEQIKNHARHLKHTVSFDDFQQFLNSVTDNDDFTPEQKAEIYDIAYF